MHGRLSLLRNIEDSDVRPMMIVSVNIVNT